MEICVPFAVLCVDYVVVLVRVTVLRTKKRRIMGSSSFAILEVL